jgi:nitroreductase
MEPPRDSSAQAEFSLPTPQRDSNAFFQLLQRRRSARAFARRPLELQILANLLWAAFGTSTLDGYRTAPSARNWREIDIFLASGQGLFRYEPYEETVARIHGDDIRALTGLQDFVCDAPVNLVYVANHDRMAGATEREREFYSAADTGVIAQNVYLACAASGLATVVRGLIDRKALAKAMRLSPCQRITLAQSIGYPSS